jgi:hypothetical protein
MFVRDFAQLDRPFVAVASQLGDDLGWLSPLAEDAADHAIRVASELLDQARTNGNGTHVRAGLECRIGPARARLDGLVLPVEFDPGFEHAAFPPLHAHLELAPLGRQRTLLSLDASYRTPVPDLATAAVLQRATQAGIRKLVSDIACHLGGGATP